MTGDPSQNRPPRGAAPLAGFRDLLMHPGPKPRARFAGEGEAEVRTLSQPPPEPVTINAHAETPVEASAAPAPPTPSTAPSPPLWSGKIRPGDEVGRGAMGAILRGTDTKLRRELALKVTTQPRDRLPQDQLARFVEEAQITAQLEHPNVVPVHDIGIDPEGRAYFSMKLVRGRSLETILERRSAGDPSTLSEFGLRRLLDIFLQICQGVDYAHARGVIHRDLKPANIMVGDFGEVLVMDWGVAKLKGRDESLRVASDVTSVRAGNQALATQFGAVIGTPAYMSPEQAKGLSVDERTDLYSLGVILYEILCGAVPFDGTDASSILSRLLSEAPTPPSKIRPNTPLALEALALRLLEKDPDRRTLTIRQIRSHVQDYIEGIGREYRREGLSANAVWLGGALSLFAFIVWYLTGQSVARVVALTPPTVFNALGWLLLVMAIGYPLWAASTSLRVARVEHDRFRPPTSEELFVSGYLAHRTRAATIAPLFQLVFIVELLVMAVLQVSGGAVRAEVIHGFAEQIRAEWGHALIVILVFLFAYLLLLSSEVRFARRVDRYVLLVRRSTWESVWPFFLIVLLLVTIAATDLLDWTLAKQSGVEGTFLQTRILGQHLDPFEIVKTVVFQGTFLLGIVAATVLLAFPFEEVLASLRMAYQPADDASVASREQYFLRSLSVFQVARANWLYGGAMIGSLTAVTILSKGGSQPLVEQILYILVPSLIGFLGYTLTRRYALAFLSHAPAVRRMLDDQIEAAQAEQIFADVEQLRGVSWRSRLLQLAIPLVCVLGYLLWTGSGVHQQAIRQLMMPVSAKGWLLILPYALLVPLLLTRDPLQLRRLQRKLG